MEHAARHHISIHVREDPAHYNTLSERLEQIIATLEGRWAELVEADRPYLPPGPRGGDT